MDESQSCALEPLRQLINNLTGAVDDLEKIFSAYSLDFPSLDVPFTKSNAEDLTQTADAVKSINIIVASSYQLLSTARHPFGTLCDASSVYQLSSCLRVAENLNIPEIIRENGTHGCHVGIISQQCNMDPSKLSRILRVLASHHIFLEVSPDIFANNRVSSFFDSGKKTAMIKTNALSKYQDAVGISGYIGTFTDEVAKASTYLLENLKDENHGKGFAPEHGALQAAVNTQSNYFSWLEEPHNEYRLGRYAECIRGTSLWDAPEAILEGFNWADLPPNSTIVDVGGGTGAPLMVVASEYPHFTFIIQDREAVISQAREHWSLRRPDLPISFQVHDFFKEQPQKNAAVFLVRTICHDWPDHLAIEILRNLRQAAGDTVHIPGAELTIVPEPLLSNMGKASANVYWIDMTMQVLLNGQERTLPHHIQIMREAGWNPIRVNRCRNSHFGYLVAECVY
ncbi:hypothetical protein D9757_005108 [Collybiopsis confluens]|uniref:O-methyltransferase n=1 Tax=Collybiopsis confluens TaxID=2823264 RepID=A0A8H5HTM2_9AGAR|nr:hypothetical protein D9757_005108 [Collybiopsis confluens]